MSISDRIGKIIEKEGVSVRSFEQSIETSNGVIARALSKKTDISSSWLSKIIETYPKYNADWLLTGKGEMLKDSPNDHIVIEDSPVLNQNAPVPLYLPKSNDKHIDIQQIPLYEIEASAGLSMLFSNQSTQVPIGYITIPNAPRCDGAVPIRGDSMYPLLKSGDIACYKHLISFDNIQWGEIYIIYIDADGDEMFVTKYVQKSEIGDDYISLISYNKHHQPQDILKKHIKAMAMMKISIRYNTNI